ncbi:MAG: Uma2 family endonuclease [Blastocatellia bacterium]
MALPLAHKLFTVSEYFRMIELGVLNEDDRMELLEGEIIKMAAIGPGHAACLERLADYLAAKIKKLAMVRRQNPIGLSDISAPEPDIVLVKPRDDYYIGSHPKPDDVILVIEVAETTAETDRHYKIPMYARAGIPEAWLIDLVKDRIEVYTQPADGIYREIRITTRDQRVISEALPNLKLKADDILG